MVEQKQNFSPVAKLALARTMQRVGEEFNDPDLVRRGRAQEQEAQAELAALRAQQGAQSSKVV